MLNYHQVRGGNPLTESEKRSYAIPKMQIISFEQDDILTASNEVGFELNDSFFGEGE